MKTFGFAVALSVITFAAGAQSQTPTPAAPRVRDVSTGAPARANIQLAQLDPSIRSGPEIGRNLFAEWAYITASTPGAPDWPSNQAREAMQDGGQPAGFAYVVRMSAPQVRELLAPLPR